MVVAAPRIASPEATVTLLARVKSNPFGAVILVPEGRVRLSVAILKIVTDPLADVPIAFLPVAVSVTVPSSETESEVEAIREFAMSVGEDEEKVTEAVLLSCFGLTRIVIVAFLDK